MWILGSCPSVNHRTWAKQLGALAPPTVHQKSPWETSFTCNGLRVIHYDLTIWFINPVFQPRILYMCKIWGSSYPTPTPHLSIVWSNITNPIWKETTTSLIHIDVFQKAEPEAPGFLCDTFYNSDTSRSRDTSTRHVFFRPHPTSGGLPSISALITRVRILKP